MVTWLCFLREGRPTIKSTSDSDIGADDVSVTVHVPGSLEVEPTGTIGIHGNASSD